MSESTFITPKVLAERIGISPKRLRSFMRAHQGDEGMTPACGAGNRYALTPQAAQAIERAFVAYKAKRAEA